MITQTLAISSSITRSHFTENPKVIGYLLGPITVHSPATIVHESGRLMCCIGIVNIVALKLKWNKKGD